MSEITGTAVAHEAYAFCCMRCGHGWEQSYDIEHHVDGSGQNFVVYKADGQRVPSPLSSPSCENCGGHVVRIMRSGQVSSVRALADPFGSAQGVTGKGKQIGTAGETDPVQPAGGISDGTAPAAVAGRHHWHLSDLLHPFQHRR
ncbi:hypothetical protein [Streptomyces sp. NPDC051569]|uniref:hypothetical protein n=1 Tax=Streptomyces sp. NPDC051569 TaxID=3365661 RepID=UPI0037B189FE